MCLEVHFFNNLIREAENMVANTPNSDAEAALADADGTVRERHFQKTKGLEKKMKGFREERVSDMSVTVRLHACLFIEKCIKELKRHLFKRRRNI